MNMNAKPMAMVAAVKKEEFEKRTTRRREEEERREEGNEREEKEASNKATKKRTNDVRSNTKKERSCKQHRQETKIDILRYKKIPNNSTKGAKKIVARI